MSAAESMDSSEIDVSCLQERSFTAKHSQHIVIGEEWEVENAQRDDVYKYIKADQRNELGERVQL